MSVPIPIKAQRGHYMPRSRMCRSKQFYILALLGHLMHPPAWKLGFSHLVATGFKMPCISGESTVDLLFSR